MKRSIINQQPHFFVNDNDGYRYEIGDEYKKDCLLLRVLINFSNKKIF